MKDDGVRKAIALPLYPHYCRATTGSSLNDLRRSMRRARAEFPLREVKSYPDHPGYVAALAEKISEMLPADGKERMHLLFNAHGVPKSVIDAGDPYQEQVMRTVAAVTAKFPGLPHSVSYQSRLGPVE